MNNPTAVSLTPGYDESIRWNLRFWPGAGIWAGNLLNILLYIPLGWTAARTQHLTARGCADVNDVVFLRRGQLMCCPFCCIKFNQLLNNIFCGKKLHKKYFMISKEEK